MTEPGGASLTEAVEEAIAAPPPIGEMTLEALEALEKTTSVPVVIADSEGNVLGASPNEGDACSVVTAQWEERILSSDPAGDLYCRQTSCPFHGGYSTASVPEVPGDLRVVHCAGAHQGKVTAQLAASALLSDGEKLDMMDLVAHSYEELHLVQSFASAFEEEIDHRMTFLKILSSLGGVFPFSAAEIWVLDTETGDYRCILHYEEGKVRKSFEVIGLSSDVEELLRRMGPRVLRAAPTNEAPLDRFLREILTDVGVPAVVVPLLTKSRVLGVLLMRIPHGTGSVDSAKLRILTTAGKQTSLVLQVHVLFGELKANEGLRREIEIARQIQHSLLPQTIPESETFDLFASCVTAARVGGDYYDFFRTTPRTLGLLIADVSGHSVASGLVAMSFRSSFRHFLEEQQLEMAELFGRVNGALQGELSRTGHFLSASYCTFDEDTGTLRYVDAGHHPPLVYHTVTGKFRTLEESSGLLIGVLPDWEYAAAETTLSAGEILFLYTDGVIEAENQRGEMFGTERLKGAIAKHSFKSAKEMYHYVLRELYVFQDEEFNQDDVTLMILKVGHGEQQPRNVDTAR